MGKKTKRAQRPTLPRHRTERRNIADLRPADYNPRTISEEALGGLTNSVRRFGIVQPVVVNQRTGRVIAGHQRLRALESLGESEADVLVVDLSEEEEKALNLALNSQAISGEFTEDLDALLEEIQGELPDLFDDLLLDELTSDLGEELDYDDIADDEPPALPDAPTTKPGDLWLLGDHRVLCGDATRAEDVERLFAGETADAVLSDPPYGVDYEGKTKNALTIENDSAEGLLPLLEASLGLAFEHSRAGAPWYIAAPSGPSFYEFATVLRALEVWRQTMIWVKDSAVLGRSDYHWRHEAIFYGWKPGAAHRPVRDRTQTTVWEVPRPKANRDHPTMKPVRLYARAIRNSTQRSELIYEPFSGSGTTLIAAESLGRRCYAMELDPRYVDVTVRRWEKKTGKEARRGA